MLCICAQLFSISISSVTQSCPTLCHPMNRSTPGLPVHHKLPELTQTHVHWVSDAIQPSHPLLSPSPPALNLSQHQGLFKWVSSSHQVAKVLELQLYPQSFQWTPRTDSVMSNSVTPWTVARQVLVSVGFSRQEYWSGLTFPPPEDLPDPGIELASPMSPAWAGRFFVTRPPGKLDLMLWKCQSLSHVQLFVTPWTVAHQTPLSMEFSRQE